MTVGHIFVIGETRGGKTYGINQLHRGGPENLLSIFFNTNQAGGIWGTRCDSLRSFILAVGRGDRRINYVPPADKSQATDHLWALWHYLFKHSQEGPVWVRLIVDEAQRFHPPGDKEGPVEDACRRGLGRGIQLVVITQYSPGVKPGTRTNCTVRIFYNPGLEGRKLVVDQYGVPPALMDWTGQKYHAVSYTADRGWRQHPPVGTS